MSDTIKENKFKAMLASDTFRSIASAVICALVGIIVGFIILLIIFLILLSISSFSAIQFITNCLFA